MYASHHEHILGHWFVLFLMHLAFFSLASLSLSHKVAVAVAVAVGEW